MDELNTTLIEEVNEENEVSPEVSDDTLFEIEEIVLDNSFRGKLSRINPYLQGMITVVISFILLVTVGAYMQTYWGLLGLFTSELVLLLFAVFASWLFKFDLKKAFPIHIPEGYKLLGSFISWIGCYGLVILVALIATLLFPDYGSSATDDIIDYISDHSAAAILLTFSLVPAVCEEALFRGSILSSFKKGKHRWLAILLCGLIFGFFHLDPLKFFTTGILGLVLAYVLCKTDNLVYTVFMHFANNLVSTLPVVVMLNMTMAFTSALDLEISEISDIPLSSYGLVIAIFAVFPLILAKGLSMLDGKPNKADFAELQAYKLKSKKIWKHAYLTGAGLVFIGTVVTVIGMF